MRFNYHYCCVALALLLSIVTVSVWSSAFKLSTTAKTLANDFQLKYEQFDANVTRIYWGKPKSYFFADISLLNNDGSYQPKKGYMFDCPTLNEIPHCKYLKFGKYFKSGNFVPKKLRVYVDKQTNHLEYLIELPKPFEKYEITYYKQYVEILQIESIMIINIFAMLCVIMNLKNKTHDRRFLRYLTGIYTMFWILNVVCSFPELPIDHKFTFDYGEIIDCKLEAQSEFKLRGRQSSDVYSFDCVVELNGKYANLHGNRKIHYNTECPNQFFTNLTKCLDHYKTYYTTGKYIGLFIHAEDSHSFIWHSHELSHFQNSVYWRYHSFVKFASYFVIFIYNVVCVTYMLFRITKRD